MATKNLTMLRESAISLNDRLRAVQAAVSAAYNSGLNTGYCYAFATFDDHVIIEKEAKGITTYWRENYTLGADGSVTLAGSPVTVVKSWTEVGGLSEGMLFGPQADEAGTGELQEGGEGQPAKPTGKKWGVLIIQEGMSKNRNRYQRKVLQEAAPLYEGAKVYIDHQEDTRRFGRSARDLAGFIKDVQPVLLATTKEATAAIFGLAGTMVVTQKAIREELLDAWEEGKADLLGLSHDALAESVAVVDPAGAFYDVTRIESVKSVDLVTNPAAGGRVLRLVASDTVPLSLSEDEAMLKKLMEAIRATKNAALIAKLEALGANPTEDQIMALHTEALTAAAAVTEAAAQAAAAPAVPAVPATPAVPAPVKEAVAQPTGAISIQEALELKADGITLFVENTLNGCSLPDPVKKQLRGRFMAQVTEATTLAGLPTKAQVTAAVKESVDLFASLAESGVVMPVKHTIQMGQAKRDKVSESLDAFFGVKVDGKDENGREKVKLVREGMQSFRSLYVDITGDTNITGRVSEATRLRESMDSTTLDQMLGDSITRRMVAMYQTAEQAAWRGTIATVVPVSDFRTQRRMRFGGYPNLGTVSQGAPYPALTSPTDEEATYAPAKRGGTEQITLEMITNDDVGAIRQIPQRLARAASQTLYEFVFDFMRTNAAVYDSVALANAGHGSNLITTALSSTQVATARLLMKKQADMSNSKRIGLSARYLFVPTDLEELAFHITQAERLVADSSLAAQANPAAPNFIRKVGITPITVDYWTDTNDYWVTADVSQTPMIEIGFLGGREEPELFVQDTPNQGSMFSNDQITYKIRHTYGGAVLDYRGFVGGIVA